MDGMIPYEITNTLHTTAMMGEAGLLCFGHLLLTHFSNVQDSIRRHLDNTIQYNKTQYNTLSSMDGYDKFAYLESLLLYYILESWELFSC